MTNSSNLKSLLLGGVLLLVGTGLAAAQVLYTEDYQGYNLGSIFSQDAAFTNQGLDNAVINGSYPVTILGTGNQALLVSRFAASSGNIIGYAVQDVTGHFTADGNLVTVELDMFHRDAAGSGAGFHDYFGIHSAGAPLVEFSAIATGSNGVYSLNGVDIPGSRWTAWTWVHYRFDLDFSAGNVGIYINGDLRLTVPLPAGAAPGDITRFKFGAGVYYRAGQTGACWFDNLSVRQMPGPLPAPETVWTEDFEGFALGDLPAQDATWWQDAAPALTTAGMNIVSGQHLRLTAAGGYGSNNAPNYAYKQLAAVGLHQERIEIAFRMRHEFSTLFHGKMAGFGILTDRGWMCRLHLLDFDGRAQLNGVDIPFPPANVWHDYVFTIELADDTVVLSVNGVEYGPVALLGGLDWQPTDLYNSSNGALAWYAGIYYPNSDRSTWADVDDIVVIHGPSEAAPPPFQIEGAEVVSLIEGRPLFAESGVHIRWGGQALGGFAPFAAVTALNTAEPLTVTLDEPGYLYALLWRWDYGMLRPADMAALHGWQLVDAAAGTALDFPAALASMSLYRRPLSAGSHEVNVTEYFGQWVIVGFAPDDGAAGQMDINPNVTLAEARTRHNVFDPGADVLVEAAASIDAVRLYSMDAAEATVVSNPFVAPDTPGRRYWLEVDSAGVTRIVPFVVGLGPVAQRGWRSDEFFPIHPYGTTDYSYRPNPGIAYDLTILAQLESGYNTLFGGSALSDALGMRRIPSTIGQTRWYMRETEMSDAAAVNGVMWVLSQYDSIANEMLGWYIEDEPPAYTADRMALVEQRFAADYAGTDLVIIYCLISAANYWQTAGTATGNFRAYPFYNSLVGDIPGMRQMTENTLIKNIDDWRAHNPDGPLWIILQTFGDPTWAIPSAEQVRLLINLSLARGVDGLTYYYWPWAPRFGRGPALWPYVPADARYDEIARLNRLITELQMHAWEWLAEIPQTHPDLDVQLLNNQHGRPVAWVTNWDWINPLTATVELPGDVSATVTLPPGSSEIIQLCSLWLTADRNNDCVVDLADFALLAAEATVPPGDSLVELAELASQWLAAASI